MIDNPKIIVALDYSDVEQARSFVDKIDPKSCRLKVGKTLFTHCGPEFVEELMLRGFDIFLDLKFHDIPQQVAGACRAAAELGVWMMSIHILGGRAMLEAAVSAVRESSVERKPLLVGITVLTSLQDSDLKTLGIRETIQMLVPNMAQLAQKIGLDGVVCSPEEAAMLRAKLDKPFLLVTPGIRLGEDPRADQKRVMTPMEAIKAGSDYLVIGRSITQAKDPLKALEQLASACS